MSSWGAAAPTLPESEHEQPKQQPQHSSGHSHERLRVEHLQDPPQQASGEDEGTLEKGADIDAKEGNAGARVGGSQGSAVFLLDRPAGFRVDVDVAKPKPLQSLQVIHAYGQLSEEDTVVGFECS